tara:strand:- start:468 stop:719 length:252 start_codon:yes stop_codon:yes gene_type:complete
LSEEKININSPEEISQQLSDDDLKDVAGGKKKVGENSQLSKNKLSKNKLASPFVPGGAVLSAEEKLQDQESIAIVDDNYKGAR